MNDRLADPAPERPTPDRMRAFALTERPHIGATADALTLLQLAVPTPPRGHVLVRVEAASVNLDDLHLAEGTFFGGLPLQPRPSRERPVIPGTDVCGVVAALGRRVRDLSVGERVIGVCKPGGVSGSWAEYCVVPAKWARRAPRNLSPTHAAACPLSGVVAVAAVDAARLHRGSRCVVVGASGGIGTLVVSMLVGQGVEVIGVCSERTAEVVRSLGAGAVIDYARAPWESAARALGPVDAVIDCIGGRDVEARARRLLASRAAFVTVSGPERFVGERKLGFAGLVAMLTYVLFRAVWTRVRGPRYVMASPGDEALGRLVEMVEAGDAAPTIRRVVPFELDALRASIDVVRSHRGGGKIVMDVAAIEASDLHPR